MTDIPSLMVMEPSPERSKHTAAGTLVGRERRPDLDSMRERLRAARVSARRDHALLLEQLKRSLGGYPAIEAKTAATASEAVAYIAGIAGRTRLASINKSNVVVNELRPGLQEAGFETYLRYYSEFNNFEKSTFEKKVEDYWSLPGMHGRGLVESFAIRTGIGELGTGLARDYVAILGVNAISADDGSVFFLQHMANITKDLEQAQKVILIVALEKIVEDREAACLHAQAMGIFGLESVLLDLMPNDIEMYDFDARPLVQGQPRELHVLMLDNGRGGLLGGPYEDLFLCIDCRACSRQCPIGQHVMKERGFVYSPKNYLLGFLQGSLPPVEECLHCGRCQVECPVDIDIPALIWRAQLQYYEQHPRSWKKRLLDDPELLARVGSATAPLSSWAARMPVFKSLMQAFAGIHRKANLPVFHRKTFRDWMKRDHHHA